MGEKDLELAALEALRGAEDLRKRLMIEMATGTPSISDLAYAIKVRIKEDYKIIDKVIDRRTLKDKPKYCVPDIRDIVGLRIVTLYRLDALRVIPALLDRIEAAGDSPAAIFKPDSVEEIKIFSPNPKGDAQGLPNRLRQLFASRGKEALIAQEPSNYSSVHIIVWGRGKYRDQYREIPIEIQIRTAFEDAWSEIEHALKYKRKSPQGLSVEDEDRIQIALSHLTVLKTMVDGIAQYSDQIKLQIDDADGQKARPLPSRPAEDAHSRLKTITGLPEALRGQIDRAIATARPALDGSSNLGRDERLQILREAAAQFEDAHAAIKAASLPAKMLRDVTFVTSMEHALALFEIANLLDNPTLPLVKAANIYSEMEAAFPNRLVISYRLARTLAALGDRPTAIEKLRTFVRKLEVRDSLLPKSHWLRAAAPRMMGFYLWQEALERAKLRRDPSRASEPELAMLQEAYEVTAKALHIAEALTPQDPASEPERVKCINNLLYYALEYVEGGGDGRRLDPSWGEDTVRKHLAQMGVDSNPDTVTDARLADTAALAYKWLGDAALGAAFERRTEALEGKSLREPP